MTRAPFQVLVFPYRTSSNRGFEYALFYLLTERYGGFWQAISGGGEDDETPLEAARREAAEEAGIYPESDLFQLDSMTTIPADNFASRSFWGPETLVIPEYAFAVDAGGQAMRLSHEHEEFRWADYDTAQELLHWDSNRSALWELNYRLTK